MAMEGAQFGIWTWDVQTDEVTYDHIWCEILGYPEDEIEQRYDFWESRVHPQDKEKTLMALRAMLSGQTDLFRQEYRLRTKSGEWKWVVGRGSITGRNAAGETTRVSGIIIDINTYRKAENERREPERLYQQISDSTFEAIFLSENGICVGQNKTAERMFGYTNEEAMGRCGTEWIHPDHRDQVMENMISGFEGLYDSVGLRKDGSTFPCEVQARMTTFNGKPMRITALRDATERTRALEALRDSELRFKALHNASFGGIAIHDRGVILDCNQGLTNISGYSTDELVGMDGLLLIAEDSRKQVMDNIVAQYEKPYEVTGLRKDGQEYPLRLEARGIPYKGHNVRVVEFRDISLRKQAEKALAESETKYRALFSQARDPILVADMETGNFVECNQTAEAYFGIPRHELVGMHHTKLHPGEQVPDGISETFQKHTKNPDSPIELTLMAAGGEKRLLSVNASTLTIGGRSLAMGVFRDITNERRAEEQLILAKEEAEKANITKTQFLANMSHEIRTPLNGVMGMLQLLVSTGLDEEQQEYSVIAIESCRRLTRLLSDILDISKIEAGKLTLLKRHMDLGDVINQVVVLFQATSTEAGVGLITLIDPTISENLEGDPARLLQVLTNLVGNSFKFTSTGFVTIEASRLPTTSPHKQRVLFSVIDTGTGIDDDTVKTLFTPFTQGDASSTRQYEGAGLGLSICKQLVELMGGSLSIESEVGKGSSIHFTVLFDLLPDYQPQLLSKADLHGQGTTAPLTILIAEDVRINRLAICKLLEKRGHEVTAVENGRQALTELKHHTYDLLLMDVQMPIMDGIGATKRIRSGEAGPENRDIPIIALTAHAMTGDRELFLAAGMNDYLAKPVDAAELFRMLDRQTRQ